MSRNGLLVLVLACMSVMSACGGGGADSFTSPQPAGSLSGDWQFTMTPPSDNSFVGGLQGGFMLQNKDTANGAVVYSISLPGSQTSCSSGTAPVTVQVSGKNVTLNAVAGLQTFTLMGTFSGDNKTMTGTYSSTDGQGCGTAQSGLSWSAILVPPLNGIVTGSLHSVTSANHLSNQDFLVTGTLIQGTNIGASNATVTGWISTPDYPCFSGANVNGQISGSSVILQLIGSDGINAGQIGAPVGFTNPSPVKYESSSQGGNLLHGVNGYGVSTKKCPGGNIPGDIGNVCLALGATTACTQPIMMTPASISFPAQPLGNRAASQAITVTNIDPSGDTLTDLSLTFQPQSGTPSPFGFSDFNGVPNFSEQDTCASSPGANFSLGPQESCVITVSFAPQQSCPWLPSALLGGIAPTLCPASLTATATVTSPTSADGNRSFAVPISGKGLSAIVPSTHELDFGAEAPTQSSLPQVLSFTNSSNAPVLILPALSDVCVNPPTGLLVLPRPLAPGSVAGLQVDMFILPDPATIDYLCDSDLTSKLPNFQISADTCSGSVLQSQASCMLQVTYAPQPATSLISGLDYFLELNTLQCTDNVTTNCEIDSGRFPVELKANLPSPLRMSPAAGLDFLPEKVGQTSLPMRITLFNDPDDPNSETINFTGNLVNGDFFERDDCGPTLVPGSSCTLSITFTPKSVGFRSGTITIGYSFAQTQTIYLRGTGQ